MFIYKLHIDIKKDKLKSIEKLKGPTSLLLVGMAYLYWAYVILKKKPVVPFKALRLPDTSAVPVTLFSILELKTLGTLDI